MSFLVPAAGFLALTLPAIIALYFLRIRRPTRIVPALNLWPDQIIDEVLERTTKETAGS